MSSSHTASTIVQAEKCDSEEEISLFGTDSFNEMENFGTDSIEEIANDTIWWNRKESELQVDLNPSDPSWTDSTRLRL